MSGRGAKMQNGETGWFGDRAHLGHRIIDGPDGAAAILSGEGRIIGDVFSVAGVWATCSTSA
jgi:hypothetical protein